MNIYTRKLRWKFLLFIAAVSIGVSSLWYTNNLVRKLAVEERKRAELLAEAQQKFVNAELTDKNLDFYGKVMQNNETVPVIVVDSLDNILFMRNLDSSKMDNPRYVEKKLKQMKEGRRSCCHKSYPYRTTVSVLQQINHSDQTDFLSLCAVGHYSAFHSGSLFCIQFIPQRRTKSGVGRPFQRNGTSVGHSYFLFAGLA